MQRSNTAMLPWLPTMSGCGGIPLCLRLGRPRAKHKIRAYLEIIDQILEHGQGLHRKQRHTKHHIFERLRRE